MMGLIVSASKVGINEHFADRLKGIPGNPEMIAYVVGVLGKRKWGEDDLSNQSVLLTFMNANERGDFAAFQRIGDWVLFADIIVPDHFKGVREFVENLGRQSYLRCFRMMGKQWPVYEELAVEFPTIVSTFRRRLA